MFFDRPSDLTEISHYICFLRYIRIVTFEPNTYYLEIDLSITSICQSRMKAPPPPNITDRQQYTASGNDRVMLISPPKLVTILERKLLSHLCSAIFILFAVARNSIGTIFKDFAASISCFCLRFVFSISHPPSLFYRYTTAIILTNIILGFLKNARSNMF